MRFGLRSRFPGVFAPALVLAFLARMCLSHFPVLVSTPVTSVYLGKAQILLAAAVTIDLGAKYKFSGTSVTPERREQ